MNQVRRQATAYYLALVEQTLPTASGLSHDHWFDRIAGEYDGIQTALRALADVGDEQDAEQALRLAAALTPFWLARLLALPQTAALTSTRALAIDQAGRLAFAAAQSPRDLAEALPLFSEGLSIRRTLDDRGKATPIVGEIQSLLHMGVVVWYGEGDVALARVYFEEARTLAEELGNHRGVAYALNQLGTLAVDQGDLSEARRCLGESLAILGELGSIGAIGGVMFGFAGIAAALGYHERAWRLAAVGNALTGGAAQRPGLARAKLDTWIAPARIHLSPAAQAHAWQIGSVMSLEQGMAEARAL